MTIDEAIEHAKEVARTCDDSQCAAEHMQLAEWLRQARGADKAQRWYTAKLGEARLDISNLMTENAKLRELCAEMFEAVKCCCSEWCTKTASNCDNNECGWRKCYVALRELGVEVEDV